MRKKILLISMMMASCSMAPLVAKAAPAYFAGVMEVAMEPEVNITYEGGTLFVTGAENQTMEIVSLTGKKVMDAKIESPSQKFELNLPKGCYIVKIGKVVRKVSVR